MMNKSHYWEGNSTSTSESSQQNSENDMMLALLLPEEYVNLDASSDQRETREQPCPRFEQNQQTQHVTRTKPPGIDQLRLLQRLQLYGLCEVQVSADGNCQFRSLSEQLFGSPKSHKHVRRKIVKQLKHNRSLYEGYVPMKYEKYCKKMGKTGEWGDHITLQAAADKFSAKITLLTSFKDTCFIEIIPQQNAPDRVLWLSFRPELHYNPLYAIPDVPVQHKQKRKHWLFF